MENPIKMDDFGGTTIFGNIHMETGKKQHHFLPVATRVFSEFEVPISNSLMVNKSLQKVDGLSWFLDSFPYTEYLINRLSVYSSPWKNPKRYPPEI